MTTFFSRTPAKAWETGRHKAVIAQRSGKML